MALRERAAFHAGINYYVPKMALSNSMIKNMANGFSLGSPAAPDNDIIDNDIDADAEAGTVTTQSYTADSPFGRTVTMNANADPGAGGIVDVYGYDYLGQPMVERFTFTSGSTAVLYGKKAFKSIYQTKIVGAAANATTYDLGTGYRLGLPYKGDILWAKENGVYVECYKRDIQLSSFWSDADLTAGMSHFVRSPCPGYVSTLIGIPDGAGSTNDPVQTVELGGTAITGLTVTIDTSDTAGLNASDTPTTPGYSANNRLRAGSMIEIVSAAAASAGSGSTIVVVTPTQFTHPVTTDPQTTTTGDPRGTYESLMDMDGVKEIIVALRGDPSYNSSGNGGLHGIRHVVS